MKSFYELSVLAKLHQRKKLNEADAPVAGVTPTAAATTASPVATPKPAENTTMSASQILAGLQSNWGGFYSKNDAAFRVLKDQNLMDLKTLTTFQRMGDTLKNIVQSVAAKENAAKAAAAKSTPTNANPSTSTTVTSKATPATTAATPTAAPSAGNPG